MSARSAGVLLYRRHGDELEVLLVHPGGPFWRNKDLGAWSIPKGEYEPGEAPEAAALREFAEELGVTPKGELRLLGEIRQTGGKRVVAFALEGNLDVDAIRSNQFELEWPPRSGHVQSFPEVDRAGWFTLPLARDKMIAAQRPLLDLLRKSAAPAD
jgi:predicted NUDIX family NTP pyrophosphohydrolase